MQLQAYDFHLILTLIICDDLHPVLWAFCPIRHGHMLCWYTQRNLRMFSKLFLCQISSHSQHVLLFLNLQKEEGEEDRRTWTSVLLLSSSYRLLLHWWFRGRLGLFSLTKPTFYLYSWSQHSCSISPSFLLNLYYQPLLAHWILSCILGIRFPGMVGERSQT